MERKQYATVKCRAEAEFVERKSRFIGYITPVKTEQEAVDFFAEIKSMHKTATHNVPAFILLDGITKRCSDDGEPQGTAGKPILDVLEKEGIVGAAIVVTRYFGGTLLGTGGLVRAYTQGAKEAIHAAGLCMMTLCSLVEIQFDYAFYGKLQYILPKYDVIMKGEDFGALVSLKLLFAKEQVERFQNEIREMSADTVVPTIVEDQYAELKVKK